MSGRSAFRFSSKVSRWISASGALLAGLGLAGSARADHWAYVGSEGPATPGPCKRSTPVRSRCRRNELLGRRQ
jgi:hypothetical protein